MLDWLTSSKHKQREQLDQRLFTLAMETKKNPLSELYLSTVGGGAQEHNVNKLNHLKVYFANAWAFASIRAIAEAVSAVPIRVQERDFEDGKEVWTTLDDHPLQRIIDKPNPEEPIEFLMNKVIVSLLGSGDAYLYAPKLERELYALQPSWVKVKTDKIGRRDGYEIKDREVKKLVDPEEIIHFRLVNPTGEYYGMPPSAVIDSALVTKIHLDSYIKNYFKHNAMLGTVFSTEQSLTEDQRAQMRQDIDRLHKGADKAFRMAILDGGVKAETLAHALKDLIPTEVTKNIREEVLAVYKTSPIILGSLDGASYSNADIQVRLFYKNAVVPAFRIVETFFNLQYTPQFGDNLRIWFDREEVPELQEDLTALHERARADWGVGGLSYDEFLEKIGSEPIGGRDGKMRLLPMGATPFYPNEELPTPFNTEAGTEEEYE